MKEDALHFLSEQNFNELKYLGYTKLCIIPADELKALTAETEEFIKEIKKNLPKGELFNLINASYEIKSKSSRIVDKYLVPPLKSIADMSTVDVLPVSHLVKPFGRKSGIWHQDSSIVDERESISLNAWMPLVDSHRLNGCMWMFPGSHINENHFRQFGYNYIEGDLLKKLKKHLIPIKVKAGEIVLFHRNIIHGSSNNWLPKDRIAVEAVVVSKNAQLYNFHRESAILENKILGFKVDADHFSGPDPKQDFYNGKYEYEVFDDEEFKSTQKYLMDNIPLFINHAKQLEN